MGDLGDLGIMGDLGDPGAGVAGFALAYPSSGYGSVGAAVEAGHAGGTGFAPTGDGAWVAGLLKHGDVVHGAAAGACAAAGA